MIMIKHTYTPSRLTTRPGALSADDFVDAIQREALSHLIRLRVFVDENSFYYSFQVTGKKSVFLYCFFDVLHATILPYRMTIELPNRRRKTLRTLTATSLVDRFVEKMKSELILAIALK